MAIRPGGLRRAGVSKGLRPREVLPRPDVRRISVRELPVHPTSRTTAGRWRAVGCVSWRRSDERDSRCDGNAVELWTRVSRLSISAVQAGLPAPLRRAERDDGSTRWRRQ